MNLTSNLKLSRCPHCSVASPLLKVRDQFQTKDEANNNARTWGVYVCSSCGGVVTAWATNSGFSVQEFFPQIQLISEDIPEMPRANLQQAHSSFHAPAGAVMLAASAVDAMLNLFIGVIYANLSIVHLSSGDSEKAEYYFNEAIRLSMQTGSDVIKHYSLSSFSQMLSSGVQQLILANRIVHDMDL